MKISKIEIKNYRLLKEFSIDLEDNLSLVIGKNNTGKTSFLSLLERFLLKSESNQFTFDDFNLDFQAKLKNMIEGNIDFPNSNEVFGVNMKLHITYNKEDDLSNISALILDLDQNIKEIIISFEYSISSEKYENLKKHYNNHIKNSDGSDLTKYLKNNHAEYFSVQKKSIEFNNENNFIDLKKEKISIENIISFQRIKAKRDVTNSDGTNKNNDRTLSKMSAKYYNNVSNNENSNEHILKLEDVLNQADTTLNKAYTGLFDKIINKIKKFGGITENESVIEIISNLDVNNVISENTNVMYNYNGQQSLPEDYNGLGYMNLIALIFEMEVLLNRFSKINKKNESPSDINILFIEEPEAHTHPQMQSVFIKNIKTILEEASDNGKIFNLQTIITTHSPYIVSESDFDDVKYFHKKNATQVQVKNLKSLKNDYTQKAKEYVFLKQYLTLNRAELFFADKAIFIEGDTERILLSTMMKKIDIECKNNSITSLLSQNISIVEVGAYAHIFQIFIDFLGIKALIITDIDTSLKEIKKDSNNNSNIKNQNDMDKMTSKPVRVKDANITTNKCINYFYKKEELSKLIIKPFDSMVLKKENNDWLSDTNGHLAVIYQIEEKGYHARSFEDAFIHINRDFINTNKKDFKGLKNRKKFDDTNNDAFSLASSCIGDGEKTSFALDILFHSSENYINWEIPAYIKEGLLWLQK